MVSKSEWDPDTLTKVLIVRTSVVPARVLPAATTSFEDHKGRKTPKHRSCIAASTFSSQVWFSKVSGMTEPTHPSQQATHTWLSTSQYASGPHEPTLHLHPSLALFAPNVVLPPLLAKPQHASSTSSVGYPIALGCHASGTLEGTGHPSC